MKVNAVKQRLATGQSVVGINAALGSAEAAGFLARAGFDLVLVDNQHGNWDDTTSLQAFQRITLEGCTPFTRVRKNDFYAIGRMLDRGTLGVVVPFVNSVEGRRRPRRSPCAIRRCGGRSYGFTLAEYHGAGYGDWADDQVYLGVQIESAEAVTRAEDILAVKGVDGCWIGPTDLAASLSTRPRLRGAHSSHLERAGGVQKGRQSTGHPHLRRRGHAALAGCRLPLRHGRSGDRAVSRRQQASAANAGAAGGITRGHVTGTCVSAGHLPRVMLDRRPTAPSSSAAPQRPRVRARHPRS